MLETDGSGNVKARNLYGTNLISRQVDNESLYYMYNGHGDVTALIGADGTIVASYYYDAFGVPTEQTGNADNPFRYAGYEYDEDTGLYYLKARFYDAAIARFIQEDTFRGNPNDPLSLNLYTYVHNNPLMYIDPTGHEREDITKYEKSTVYNLTDLVAMYGGSVNWDEKTKSATVVFYKNGEYHNYTFRLADGWKVKNRKIQITLGTFQNIISKPGRVYVPKVTAESIMKNLGLGVKDTAVSTWEGMKSLTTAEGLNNLGVAITPISWGDAEMAKKKLQMYEALGNKIQSSYNEFVEGDWNVKSYYISRVGSEIVLTFVGTKGTQYVTKAVKLGKAEELTGISSKLDDAIGEAGQAARTAVSTSTKDIKVVGRIDDTAVAKSWKGHDVLDDPNWTMDVNDAWVNSGIKNKQDFYIASPMTEKNLISANPKYPGETVFGREIRILKEAGYVQKGDYFIHPDNLK